jgi:putative holliday junction resolvase
VSGPGRLLGVDHGKVRLGLAVSDAERRLSSPLQTYTRHGKEQDAVFFRELVKKEEIVQIVVGLPAHLDGREGEQARLARAFGKWLGDVTGLSVVFFDESFTTHDAEQHLQAAGLTSKKRKARRDRVAAQIMLQAYLETYS